MSKSGNNRRAYLVLNLAVRGVVQRGGSGHLLGRIDDGGRDDGVTVGGRLRTATEFCSHHAIAIYKTEATANRYASAATVNNSPTDIKLIFFEEAEVNKTMFE